MTLYIETNFILGLATGRDPLCEDLMRFPATNLRIVLPEICLMEAWSAYEDEERRRNSFGNTLNQQISQLRRDLTSAHAKSLLAHLEESLTDNINLLNDVEARLRDTLAKLMGLSRGYAGADIIRLTKAGQRRSLTHSAMGDPTDNLVLAAVLEHARKRPTERKAFLSGNKNDFDVPDVRALLAEVGISDYFAKADTFLGWFQAQP